MSVEPGTRHHWPGASVGKRTPFIGREEEQATLQQLLKDATGGHGTVAMIGGEPGVGKTRLAEELAAEARERGFLTVTGHSYDVEGGIPYQPFVEALEHFARVVPAADLQQWLGDDGPEVARLTPDLRRVFPDLPAAAAVPPEEGRRLLFHAWSSFLERAANVQPILLILDDVHWADESSLLLLQHIARRLTGIPVVVICTYRDVELGLSRPLAKTLQELVRQRLAHDVVLRTLPEQSVAAMIETHGHGTPPPGLVALVYRETEGNPFFVEEVLRHLTEEGKLLNVEGAWASNIVMGELEVPRSVRLVIEQRLARQSDGCQRLLASAAVVGRDFSFEIVGALSDLHTEALIEVIEEAERAGLIHDTSRGREARYSFSHELVRQTLEGGLSLPRRQRLHLRIAETMERVYGSTLDSHVAELAFHFRQAGAGADVEKAVDYSIRAGDEAASVFAWGEAISHYEGVLDASENARVLDGHRRCQVLLSLGEAVFCAGNAQRLYGEIAPKAFELAMTLGASEKAAHASMLAALSLFTKFGAPARPDYREWAERLERVAPDGSVYRVHADVAMARVAAVRDRMDETEERSLRALALAREIAPAEWVILSIYQTFALFCQGPRFDARRRQLAADAASSLATLPRAVTLLTAESALASIAGEALKWGDRIEASRVVGLLSQFEGQRPAEVGPQLAALFPAVLFRYMDGELEGAATSANEILAGVVPGGPPIGRAIHAMAFGWRPAYYLARTQSAYRNLLNTDERTYRSPRVVLLAAFGRRDEARAVLLRRRQSVPKAASGAPDAWGTPELVAFVEAATILGDADLAAWFAAPLWKSGAVTTGSLYTTMVDRHLGAAAALLGEPERARQYYERALAEAAAMRFRPEIALTRLGLAELLDASFPSERQSAVDHLEFAITEFEAMKMAPSLEHSLALQGRLAPRPGHPIYRDGLTPREVEVLRLVAAGRTNQQIAGELFISQNTVLRHVSHIFDKTGASNRVEAAAYAHRRGIEPPATG